MRELKKIIKPQRGVFEESAESKITLYRRFYSFKNDITTLEDDPGSGRPSTSINEGNITAVEDLLEEAK